MNRLYSLLCGFLTSIVTVYLGGWDASLRLLISVMILDFLTGVLGAMFFASSTKTPTGTLSSEACYRGIIKKVCMIVMVALANMLGAYLSIEHLRAIVVNGLIASEAFSLVENLVAAGVPCPQVVIDALDALRDNKR